MLPHLLINESPLYVLPSLAQRVGLSEAIILQRIHYLLNPRINNNVADHLYWVNSSDEQWAEQFCFWSLDTIKKALQSLEQQGLLISKDFNGVKCHTISYDKLSNLAVYHSQIDKNG